MSSDKNNNNLMIAKNILIRSGLKDIKSYEGHGVDLNDLSSVHLMCVFRDLVSIDPVYALEFIDLVKSMKDLSASNFINNFNMFALNGFSAKGMVNTNNNDSNDVVDELTMNIKKEFYDNTLKFSLKLKKEYGTVENEVEVIKRGRKL